MPTPNGKPDRIKSLERWIWDDACSIRGAQDAAKFKDYCIAAEIIRRMIMLRLRRSA